MSELLTALGVALLVVSVGMHRLNTWLGRSDYRYKPED